MRALDQAARLFTWKASTSKLIVLDCWCKLGGLIGEFETIVRWELEPRDVHGLHGSGTHRVGTGTLVKVRHSGFAGHIEQAHSHHKGWSASLERLQAFVEKGETMENRN